MRRDRRSERCAELRTGGCCRRCAELEALRWDRDRDLGPGTERSAPGPARACWGFGRSRFFLGGRAGWGPAGAPGRSCCDAGEPGLCRCCSFQENGASPEQALDRGLNCRGSWPAAPGPGTLRAPALPQRRRPAGRPWRARSGGGSTAAPGRAPGPAPPRLLPPAAPRGCGAPEPPALPAHGPARSPGGSRPPPPERARPQRRGPQEPLRAGRWGRARRCRCCSDRARGGSGAVPGLGRCRWHSCRDSPSGKGHKKRTRCGWLIWGLHPQPGHFQQSQALPEMRMPSASEGIPVPGQLLLLCQCCFPQQPLECPRAELHGHTCPWNNTGRKEQHKP
ncbi:collagen alpha-1(I) chain-like [Prinia subflava]|uniref:collagen alpha-1(I) chain-like n=1 Tax=Prinia subflava TaxID=208062 RepID=UPI002FE25A4A